MQILSSAVKQPRHVALDPRESSIGIGGGQDVPEQMAPGWPGLRVVPWMINRDCSSEQSNYHGGRVRARVGPGAQDRGEQSVHCQRGRLDLGQSVLAQQPS